MTTTTCDICNRQLEFNHLNPNKINGKASLLNSRGQSGIEQRDFTYVVTVESFHFNCTNFHVCQACLVDAVAKSVGNEPPLEAKNPVIVQGRRGNVILNTDGRKMVLVEDRHLLPMESFVCPVPHLDGDYSYLCLNNQCRCHS